MIDITGTGFPTSSYDAVLIINGVESSSSVINSATSITATFANGVPVASTAISPSLRFVPTASGGRRRLVSITDADQQMIAVNVDVTISNAIQVTGSTSGLSCSFQGGCPYSVTAQGLFSTIQADNTTYIDVCGNECVLSANSSDRAQATCTLPHVSTSYSASNYEIVKVGVLHDGTWTGTATSEELARLIDNKNMVDMTDTSDNCYFQIQYKPEHVGVLDEVKFFVNHLVDKTPFVDNLVF